VTSGVWNAARQQRRERRSALRPRIADGIGDVADELDRLNYLAHLMRRSYQRPWPPPPPLHVIARARGQEVGRHPHQPATTTDGISALDAAAAPGAGSGQPPGATATPAHKREDPGCVYGVPDEYRCEDTEELALKESPEVTAVCLPDDPAGHHDGRVQTQNTSKDGTTMT